MRYFLGYLLTGEAADYHRRLTVELSEPFGAAALHERLPPHLTFWPPFDSDEISGLDVAIHLFAAGVKPALFRVNGFGHFDSQTIFLRVASPPRTAKLVEKFLDVVQTEFGHSAGSKSSPPVFHSSVARFLARDQFQTIWQYLSSLTPPKFELVFDAITLFRLQKSSRIRRWEVCRQYNFSLCF